MTAPLEAFILSFISWPYPHSWRFHYIVVKRPCFARPAFCWPSWPPSAHAPLCSVRIYLSKCLVQIHPYISISLFLKSTAASRSLTGLHSNKTASPSKDANDARSKAKTVTLCLSGVIASDVGTTTGSEDNIWAFYSEVFDCIDVEVHLVFRFVHKIISLAYGHMTNTDIQLKTGTGRWRCDLYLTKGRC